MNPVETCTLNCPYCGEMIDLSVDVSQSDQSYIEDCSVCCRPIVVTASIDNDAAPLVTLRRDDE